MDNFDYSAIGQRIKTLRKRKGLNQTQLANLIGEISAYRTEVRNRRNRGFH